MEKETDQLETPRKHEFFVVSSSKAAPFFSDIDHSFITAKSPSDAVSKAVKRYKHPAGLYALAIYRDANAHHKGKPPLAEWLSEKAKTLTS